MRIGDVLRCAIGRESLLPNYIGYEVESTEDFIT